MSDEHYTEGRRWSHISQAWILEDSWNLQEEAARLQAENAQLKVDVEQARNTGSYWKNELHEANVAIDQLKAAIDAYKTTIAWHVKDEELYRLEIKALISVREQMERGVNIMAEEINQLKADLEQAKARGVRLRALLREVAQCFCVTQNPDDYPVDSWINKALAELRRLEEVGT